MTSRAADSVGPAFDYSDFALGFLFNVAGRLIYERTRSSLSDLGLPPELVGVLWVVRKAPGLQQKDYARIQFRDATTFGRHVDQLVALGFLERIDLADRRAKSLKLTKEGETKLLAALPIVDEVQRSVTQGISNDKRKVLLEIMHDILSELGPDE